MTLAQAPPAGFRSMLSLSPELVSDVASYPPISARQEESAAFPWLSSSFVFEAICTPLKLAPVPALDRINEYLEVLLASLSTIGALAPVTETRLAPRTSLASTRESPTPAVWR